LGFQLTAMSLASYLLASRHGWLFAAIIFASLR
jgi:hypothetical protein